MLFGTEHPYHSYGPTQFGPKSENVVNFSESIYLCYLDNSENLMIQMNYKNAIIIEKVLDEGWYARVYNC